MRQSKKGAIVSERLRNLLWFQASTTYNTRDVTAVSLRVEVHARLKAYSKASGISMAKIATAAIDEYLLNLKEEIRGEIRAMDTRPTDP